MQGDIISLLWRFPSQSEDKRACKGFVHIIARLPTLRIDKETVTTADSCSPVQLYYT